MQNEKPHKKGIVVENLLILTCDRKNDTISYNMENCTQVTGDMKNLSNFAYNMGFHRQFTCNKKGLTKITSDMKSCNFCIQHGKS